MDHQFVLILDFGGQYNQLIARRVREHNVYCEVKPYKTPLDEIKAMKPVGIIFTGGPNSVYDPDSPSCPKEIFELGVPVLGICYGCQLMAQLLGGRLPRLRMILHANMGRLGPIMIPPAPCSRACPWKGFRG